MLFDSNIQPFYEKYFGKTLAKKYFVSCNT